MIGSPSLEQSAHAVGSGTHTPSSGSFYPFSIRAAKSSDAAAIAALGAQLFKDSFGYSMPAADLSTYLDDSYNVKAIASEIAAPQHTFLVATSPHRVEGSVPPIHENDIIGFAQLTTGTTMACLSPFTSNRFELQRIYVHTAFHGGGAARALVEAVEDIGKNKLGHELMWLGVWQENPKAQRFYAKMGFRKVGSKDFRMGSCVQTDDVFLKNL